ncbi:hypothetical protein EMIHUDRAFT_220686 [Emiliania huxleyi CCMP1516]|uniref:Uncharacterized protein n=2 Tax=Emiliania huxleyi TaxID=2903 RepID=A0A0D3I0U9_EMIH1|nr:hypothetical protein EMIHUDRAFT_220686 [Emiliania huxleyi CCMP1516]EOD04884.1 hypothetical protein EMIHUDRAFT_220686 [Emiliania huxleyi CCMP1516]|eukprot:XP_005757313.1 hypothetical protein EMIHUDRAFT_220686 [Emiliania huxleyi CCMP1516]
MHAVMLDATPSNAAARPPAGRGDPFCSFMREPSSAPDRAQQLLWAVLLLLGACSVRLCEWWPPRFAGRRSKGRLVRCRTASCRGAWLFLVAQLPLACALSPSPPSPPPPRGSTCETAMPFDGAGNAVLYTDIGNAFFYTDIDSTALGPGPSAYSLGQCGGTGFKATGNVYWLRLVRPFPNELCAHSFVSWIGLQIDLHEFETDLSIFTGSCDALKQVACDGGKLKEETSGCASYYSRITGLQLTEYDQYWVVVGGWPSEWRMDEDEIAVRFAAGGVVYAEFSGAVSLIGSTLRNCSAVILTGGVVTALESGAVSLIKSTVTDCSAGTCRRFGGNDSAGETRCAGSEPVAREASRRRRLEEAGSDYCAPGFAGPECQLCAAEKHYLVDGDECKECAPRGAAAARIVGLVLGLCVACGLAAYCYSMTEWREKRCIGRLLRLADRAVYWCVAVGLTAKTKTLFGFFQVVTVLFTTYSTRLPPEYTGWTDAVADAVSIDWSGFFLPQQCLGYGLRLLAIALSPVALIALLIIAGVCLRLHPWRAAPAPHARPWYAEAALGLLDLTPAGLVLIFCFAYTTSPPNKPLEQVSYMRLDASVECGTEDHKSITDLAIGFIVLWPAGSLVLFTALLAACYKPLQAKTPTALTRATAFLHREYKTTWYWWEALELARKLVLTGFVLLIPEENALLRLVVATLICSCYVALVAATKPYKRVEDSVLAVAMSLILLLLFLGANWTTIFLRIVERSGTDDAAAVFGFSKLNPIVSTMIILAGFALLISLAGAVVAARRTAKVPTIRLVSTKQPPELTLARGLAWHLFLSHIWSTGQDTVGVIKSELQLLLPGIKVFLDARTHNCLREIRASLEQSKPLVLVQEADPAKGGGTLQALRGECPDELQSDIFDQGRTQTTWYRIEEFQRVSLKTIAVLLCSPDYVGQNALGLYVPGEPRIHSFALARPVTLWASPANAGALELASELAAAFAGLTVSTAEDRGSVTASHRRSSIMRRSTPRRAGDATHMLLYLNEDTWSDERLAEQVRQAREDRLPIVMAHENDPDKGGVPFSRFFETTPQESDSLRGAAIPPCPMPSTSPSNAPQELIANDLYKDLAKSCYPGRHHEARGGGVARALG